MATINFCDESCMILNEVKATSLLFRYLYVLTSLVSLMAVVIFLYGNGYWLISSLLSLLMPFILWDILCRVYCGGFLLSCDPVSVCIDRNKKTVFYSYAGFKENALISFGNISGVELKCETVGKVHKCVVYIVGNGSRANIKTFIYESGSIDDFYLVVKAWAGPIADWLSVDFLS